MQHSSELLKGTLATIILKLMKENGRMYGYEITQKVKEISGGKISLTEGALYPTLHRLEANGLLRTQRVSFGKRIRKYYSLTPKGVLTTKEKVVELEAFMKTIKQLMSIQHLQHGNA